MPHKGQVAGTSLDGRISHGRRNRGERTYQVLRLLENLGRRDVGNPRREVSVLLGPSGTGKSVFLKSLIGLLRPERGSVVIDGTDILQCSAKELYEIRTLFGVMFQDGALFGSMNLFDNAAFPLREHQEEGRRDP